jgi:N-acetylglutamate synthase/N-acetylornithine aminotransferase
VLLGVANRKTLILKNIEIYIMAVGEYPFPHMHPVKGVKLTAVSAGIKKVGRRDVVLFELAEGSAVAGVFTKNAFCAAPVTVCREHLATAPIRFLIINSGNANACTVSKACWMRKPPVRQLLT